MPTDSPKSTLDAENAAQAAIEAGIKAAIRSSPSIELSTTRAAADAFQSELQQIELASAEDNRRLRKQIALCVGIALALEILLLFVLVFFQGVGLKIRGSAFNLNEWAFSIFCSAVLLQTFGLAKLVVSNLFPQSSAAKIESLRAKKSDN